MRYIILTPAILLAAILSMSMNRAIASQQEAAKSKFDDWLLTDGEDQQYKVRIVVFLPDGKPATDFTAHFQKNRNRIDQGCEIEGNRITATLSTFEHGDFAELVIATNDDRFMKKLLFPGYEMRKICAEGMKTTLTPVRRVKVRVVDQDSNPIPNATLVDHALKTNADGIAVIKVPADQPLLRISARAPDGTAALMNLYDQPDKAKLNEYELKTNPRAEGTTQTIRLVDENGAPAANVGLSPQPMDRKIGVVSEKGYPMSSDEKGEVQLTWVPEAPGPRAFIMVFDNDWYAGSNERTPDIWTLNVKRLERKRVNGKVILPEGVQGGFLVQFTCFDYPTDNRVDQVYTRTDGDGNFSADVLTGAPYGVFVVDSQWTSSFWDGVLISKDGTLNSPELTISPGQPIKIVATVGEGNSPMANTAIAMSREQIFRTNKGQGGAGPRWFVTTDDNGIAHAFSAPGEIQASIYSHGYNDSKTLNVENGRPNEIRFHRKSVEMQSISGSVTLPGGSEGASGAEVIIHTTDGKSNFTDQGTASKSGKFEFRGLGERFAIFAMAADKKSAGFAFAEVEQAKSIPLELSPTNRFRGRLIDVEGQPLENCKVEMEVRLVDPDAEDLGFYSTSKIMTRFNEKTNSNGEFEFANVPTSIPLLLRINDLQVPNEGDSYLGQCMVMEDEERPLETFQVGRAPRTKASETLDQRLMRLYLFCKLSSANALVLICGSGQEVEQFGQALLDTQDRDDMFWYFPLLVSHQTSQREDVKQALKDRNWDLPRENQINIFAINATGSELDRLSVDLADDRSKQRVEEFIRNNKGAASDAKEKLSAALKEAKASNRKVWVITGHTRCAPCLLMAEWIDSQKDVLQKEYVIVKIDGVRDANAEEIYEMITSGKHYGVPFHAILDDDGTILIDANGPLGNIGFPGGSYEGKGHLRKMLEKTANSMGAAEIDTLIDSLD